jgi:hypothetical protein
MATRITRTSRDERETIVAFNRSVGTAACSTADPAMARRWQRAGWPVAVLGRYRDGTPRTWQADVPWRLAVRCARLTGMGRKAEKPPKRGPVCAGDAPTRPEEPSGVSSC